MMAEKEGFGSWFMGKEGLVEESGELGVDFRDFGIDEQYGAIRRDEEDFAAAVSGEITVPDLT